MRMEAKAMMIYETGDRVKVVKIPPGENNGRVLGMFGCVVEAQAGNYLRVGLDDGTSALFDPEEVEYVREEPQALLMRCARCSGPAGSTIHLIDAGNLDIRMAAHRFVARGDELQRLAVKAAHKVLEELNGRRGYRMDDVNEATKAEIRATWAKLIRKEMGALYEVML